MAEWTKTPPDAEGWYFMREPGLEVEIVWIRDDGTLAMAGFEEYYNASEGGREFWTERIEPPA